MIRHSKLESFQRKKKPESKRERISDISNKKLGIVKQKNSCRDDSKRIRTLKNPNRRHQSKITRKVKEDLDLIASRFENCA